MQTLFGSLVRSMCNGATCAQVHGLSLSHCGITVRAHCFQDYIYITPILLLRELNTLCDVDRL